MALRAWLEGGRKRKHEGSEAPEEGEKSVDSNQPKEKTSEKKFNDKWLSEFKWLRYDSETKQMHCSVCRDASLRSRS